MRERLGGLPKKPHTLFDSSQWLSSNNIPRDTLIHINEGTMHPVHKIIEPGTIRIEKVQEERHLSIVEQTRWGDEGPIFEAPKTRR